MRQSWHHCNIGLLELFTWRRGFWALQQLVAGGKDCDAVLRDGKINLTASLRCILRVSGNSPCGVATEDSFYPASNRIPLLSK